MIHKEAGRPIRRYAPDCEGWAYENCQQKAAFRVREQDYRGRWSEYWLCFLHVHKVVDGWIYEQNPPDARVLLLFD